MRARRSRWLRNISGKKGLLAATRSAFGHNPFTSFFFSSRASSTMWRAESKKSFVMATMPEGMNPSFTSRT